MDGSRRPAWTTALIVACLIWMGTFPALACALGWVLS